MAHHTHPRRVQANFETLAKEDGLEGAIAGAGAAAGSASMIAAWAALSITPVGWAAIAIGGAIIGATGIIKKLNE